jgi:Bacterial membrane protein YfhO
MISPAAVQVAPTTELRLPPESKPRRAVRALAGPAVICGSVLTVLHLFAFRGRISIQYPDVLPFWLPTYCFLGKTLASGAIPVWNPHVMAGVPFAADPQSGWMYLPAMTLFAALPCDVAIRWFIVLQPVLAGLGLYWFLTAEGVSRPAATVGGLALALPLAGSHLVLNLPFAGTLAWTPMVLAAASRYLSAQKWHVRLLWLGLTAGAWGQVAAANLSDGLVIATTALGAFVAARSIRDIRRGHRRGREALLLAGLLVLGLPLLTLAYFVPRLGYFPRTSIAMGYHRLDELTMELTGSRGEYLPFEGGTGPAWPARLALSPGIYLGAASLALVFAWWRASRFRALAVAFAAFGLTCYLLMLQAVARLIAPALPEFIRTFYLHDPSRFRFGLLISMAVLTAIGMEGWLEARSPLQRLTLVLPAVLVWGALPPLVGAGTPSLLLPIGAAAGLAALTLAAWRPALAWLVPAVLAVELTSNGLDAQLDGPQPVNRALLPKAPLPIAPAYRRPPRETGLFPGPINTLEAPTIQASEYVRATSLARFLRGAGDGRYLTLDRIVWDPRGYHVHQRRHRWGRLGMQQSMLFGLQEAQGYNPAQLRRYWMFVRAAERKPIRYNAAFFVQPPPLALDLLQVEWVIVSRRRAAPLPGAVPVRTEDDWMLFRLLDARPRASVVSSWRTVSSSTEALQRIRDPRFDARVHAVIEDPSGPAVEPTPLNQATGSPMATHKRVSAQETHVTVNAPSGGLVVIRNAYDPGWKATVDGRPSKLLPTNYLIQGVMVSPGRHRVVLRYRDPSIGYGLLGSGLSVVALLAGAFLLRRRA